MKVKELLERLPAKFSVEILEALPAPDRRDLLRRHGAKVKVSAGNLKRAKRMANEAKLLIPALIRSDDPDEARTYLQGWLARRAEMIVAFLDAWEIEHQGGIVEDFAWVDELPADTVKKSLEDAFDAEKFEAIAPLIYFAYLEIPCTGEVLDVDALLKGVEQEPAAS
jgi:hypothetical protein